MAHDAFLDRSPARFPTSAGDVGLPVLYSDTSAAAAFFRVEPRRAADVLAATPFAPVRFAGGTALVALAAFDHRESTIGAYREVIAAVAAVPRGVRVPALPLLHLVRERAHDDVGWFVLDLPVTSDAADVVGRELYGFPKFKTGVDVAIADGGIRVVVDAPTGEEPVLALEGRPGPGVPLGAMDLVLYSMLGAEPQRTVVEARGRMHTGLGRGLALHVGGADHPMARRLGELGLDGARPIAAQVCSAYRAVLEEPMPFPIAAPRKAA